MEDDERRKDCPKSQSPEHPSWMLQFFSGPRDLPEEACFSCKLLSDQRRDRLTNDVSGRKRLAFLIVNLN